MPSIQIRKLADALGAEVSGVDLSRSLAAGTFAEFYREFIANYVPSQKILAARKASP